MVGPFQYAIWLISFLAELYVITHAILRREFLAYFGLNIYIVAAALATAGHYFVFHRFGFQSVEYHHFYYSSEFLVGVFMFLAIIGLHQHVFREMRVSRYIRALAVVILITTVWVSYLVVRQSPDHLTTRFVVIFSQKLYFVQLLLTYLLWGAVLKLRETRLRLIQLVLSLGVFFSASAAVYGLRYLFPSLAIWRAIPPVLGCWLPLCWAYTFTRVPEEARLAPTRVAAFHR